MSPVASCARPSDRADHAGLDLADVLAVVREHADEAADLLEVALGRVEHRVADAQAAGVDAHERELAAGVVDLDLERERGERLVVADLRDVGDRSIAIAAAHLAESAGDGR